MNFDVRDSYAFNIDETVIVEMEFDLKNKPDSLHLNYDKNGTVLGAETIDLSQLKTERWYRHSFTLERARFSGRSIIMHNHSGDFAIRAQVAGQHIFESEVTICDIKLTRSNKTSQPKHYGQLDLTVMHNGNPAPARIGIYDKVGSMPLPSVEAIPLSYHSISSRVVTLPEFTGLGWPHTNRHAFYIDGHYQARLPVGQYELVIARGLEYQFARRSFDIKADSETRLEVPLSRWADKPEEGWYSGDVHIHYGRGNSEQERIILLQTQAEDLHVANLLQMDSIGHTDYYQYNWGEAAHYGKGSYYLLPGREGPRSSRGHTLQLNILESDYDPVRYHLYHEIFKATHQQGGLTGYAHVREKFNYGARFGLALDVPYGLVDLVEVLQFAKLDLGIWFDFLNLGYRLSPAAGTDYAPLAPGAMGDVRSYVKLAGPFSVKAWFDGLKAGHTYVTNGPMLNLNINGYMMGDTVKLNRGENINIAASAALNPDIDRLDRLELYQGGQLIKTVRSGGDSSFLVLNHQLTAGEGSWFVIKAAGKKQGLAVEVVAVSAPVYISVNGSGHCQPSLVPNLVAQQKSRLASYLAVEHKDEQHGAYGSLAPQQQYWPGNKQQLQQRVLKVNKKYDKLLRLAEQGRCLR
ncbi:CehA/McbA family metallohydrolase [Oceanicoccus sagamiensis]|uniref:CehA/McbA family metallohydrolase n=1 Tax=Oceanicoccus sagamiensis TaxID=716816 RepID=UPI0012F47B0E|nr:CehA/McbA family metallohydrolase [Oceanicoccus sagamiensis]